MESQDGTQQPHLVLAHKLFLLTHPDAQDIEKVRLKEEVFAAVKVDGKVICFPPSFTEFHWVPLLIPSHLYFVCISSDMASLYETLAADSVLEMDQAVLDTMRAKIDDELKKLDEK